MDDEPTCRICLTPAEPDYPLFTPCRCTGTMGSLHQDCLMEWQRHMNRQVLRCEVCSTKMRLAAPPSFGWGFIVKYGRCFWDENHSRLRRHLKCHVARSRDYFPLVIGVYLALNLVSFAMKPGLPPSSVHSLLGLGRLVVVELAKIGILCITMAYSFIIVRTRATTDFMQYPCVSFNPAKTMYLHMRDAIHLAYQEAADRKARAEARERAKTVRQPTVGRHERARREACLQNDLKEEEMARLKAKQQVTAPRGVLIFLIGFTGAFLLCVCGWATFSVIAYLCKTEPPQWRPHMLSQQVCLGVPICFVLVAPFDKFIQLDESLKGRNWRLSRAGLLWPRAFAAALLVCMVLVPCLYGVLGFYAATGVVRCPDLATPMGLSLWLLGSAYRWAIEDAVSQMRRRRCMHSVSISARSARSYYTQSLMVFFVLRGVLWWPQSRWPKYFSPVLDFTLDFTPTTQPHFMWTVLVVVALLTPLNNGIPLAHVARVWLTDYAFAGLRRYIVGTRSTLTEVEWIRGLLVMLVRVSVPSVSIGLLPLWIGRAAFYAFTSFTSFTSFYAGSGSGTLDAPNWLLWATGLALELPVLGCLVLKWRSPRRPADWFTASRASWKESAIPIFRWRALYFSLTWWVITWVVPGSTGLDWASADLVFRLITIAWPNYWYRLAVVPFVVANMQNRKSVLLPVLMLLWECTESFYDAMNELIMNAYPTLQNYDEKLWRSDRMYYSETRGTVPKRKNVSVIPPLNWAPELD